jgi:hypothetical protein
MTRAAGVDGTPKGWAVVIADAGQPVVRRARHCDGHDVERGIVEDVHH